MKNIFLIYTLTPNPPYPNILKFYQKNKFLITRNLKFMFNFFILWTLQILG